MKPTLFAFPVVLLCILFGTACSSDAPASAETQAKPAEALEIQAAEIVERRVDRTMEVVGSLEARESVDLAFEVAGRVQSINVDFGSPVAKGGVIARLDPREFELRVQANQAALAQALAQMGVAPGTDPEAVENTPATEQARAQLEDAKSKFDSAKKLIETGDISENRFTELEKAYRTREAVLRASEDDLRRQKAQVQALQAQLQLAQRELDETFLRAPFAGEVLHKAVSPGQYIKEEAPVVTLVKSRPLRLRALVSESAAGHIAKGQLVTFQTDALPGREFQGVIEDLSPSLDARARTLEVEARVTQDDPRLRPGMFAKVSVAVARGVPALMVPREAVYEIAGLKKIFTIDGGKAVERAVRTGIERDGWVEVLGESFAAGQRVAISKLDQLQDGTEVAARS